MAANINYVILSGNLVRDPEMRQVGVGTDVCSFVIAHNRKIKETEKVSFVKITVWGKQAQPCVDYLAKGSHVIVEGRVEQERWEDDGGSKKEKTGIVATRVNFPPKPVTGTVDNYADYGSGGGIGE